MQRLVGWTGASVHLAVDHRNGAPLGSKYVGSLSQMQQLYDGSSLIRLAELLVEQAFAGGRVDLRAGRYSDDDVDGSTRADGRFTFAGIVANGLLASRPHDMQGVALSARRDVLGAAAAVRSTESLLEANYALEMSRWFTVQPNVQWIVHPGGSSGAPNAVVLGAQVVIDF